jgi:hypothetical protein
VADDRPRVYAAVPRYAWRSTGDIAKASGVADPRPVLEELRREQRAWRHRGVWKRTETD